MCDAVGTVTCNVTYNRAASGHPLDGMAAPTTVTTSGARALFATRLRAERIAAGLTQEALGVRAGLSQDVARTRINRYERGVHDCDSATALSLATALGLPLAALYADTDLQSEMIKVFSKLPPQVQQRALEQLREG